MNPIAEVIGLLRIEVARRVRAWKRAIFAGTAGALLLTFALVFVLLALFLYLTEEVGAPAAALIMAAGLAVLGLGALLIASIRPAKRDLQADIEAVAATQIEQMKSYSPARARTSTLLKVLGLAFVIGLLTGRRKG